MITIRRAERKDCARMMELVRELALYEKAPEQVTVTLEHFETAGFGPNPVWWAFVAEDGGIIAGMALYYIRYSTWKGTRMYLEDIVVTDSHRSKGIGKLLFDQLLAEAREKQFSGMMWQVLNGTSPPSISTRNTAPDSIRNGLTPASICNNSHIKKRPDSQSRDAFYISCCRIIVSRTLIYQATGFR